MWAFSVRAPARDMSSANIQLTLTTLNEDGDADLFCLPEKLSRKSVSVLMESVCCFLLLGLNQVVENGLERWVVPL